MEAVLEVDGTLTTTSPGFTMTSNELGALVADTCGCAVTLEINTESHFTSMPLSVACTLTSAGSFGQAKVLIDATNESSSEQPAGIARAEVFEMGRKEISAARRNTAHMKMCARVRFLTSEFPVVATYKL
jgi:hypothetical protein